jgi:hypothetical protein
MVTGAFMEQQTTNVAVIEPQSTSLSVGFNRQALSELTEQRAMLVEFIGSQLREGIDGDFAKIPGTPKKSLLKPGAEKIANLFRLGSRIVNSSRDIDSADNFVMFTYLVEVYHIPTNRVISQCEGSANSKEKKYASAKPMDIVNTLQKMAQKRAFVGAVITATGASDFFTQDMEEEINSGKEKAKEVSQRATEQKPIDASAPQCCGKPMYVSKFVDKELGHAPWYCGNCKSKVARE